jgi:hypothetical protein
MSSFDQEREHELAELLREVRALRETIDQLKASQGVKANFPPEYAVLVRSQPELPPDYAVLVRSQPAFLPPSYEVLVRPAIPEGDEASGAGQ